METPLLHPAPRDSWLAPVLRRLLPAEIVARLLDAPGESLWATAVRRHLVSDAALLAEAAAVSGLDVWSGAPPDEEARALVGDDWARRFGIVAVEATATVLTIATATPFDLDCERALSFATGRSVRALLASPLAISATLDALELDGSTERPTESHTGTAAPAGRAEALDGAIVRLVDSLIAEGIGARASDIHLEREATGVVVRHRVDGLLRGVRTLDPDTGLPLVSRIKIMAGLDIADRLRPQDGRLSVNVGAGQVDLRVSTLPAAHGEKVVMRILDARAGGARFESLGLAAPALARLRGLLEIREGLVLVTGPTGSGKTTTLYAALRAIQERGVNVVTVEDPIEYRLPGIVQVQVNARTGLTFASALRSILRQDPDVILVGEIRDAETANIAVQAALTGHLVLSTLHTIDAASAVARLDDLGVDRYKVAASLKGVIAQRLLRRLCESCREPDDAVPGPALGRWLPPEVPRWREKGCAACGRTGFRGRIAVVESMVSSPEIERAIAAGAATDTIADGARAGGMVRLWEGGIERVKDGATSLGEVARVLDMPLPPATELLVRRARESLPARLGVRLAASLDDFELVEP
ncbi:MAG TPA: GspE/PulE family protein [Gemmatimonadaceae bacterium]|nr:GspE/PulE family protein [Gemmatimonadaceae bacterium]